MLNTSFYDKNNKTLNKHKRDYYEKFKREFQYTDTLVKNLF